MLVWTLDDLLGFFLQVHSLIVVYDKQKMPGAVSLSDTLNYLIYIKTAW